CITRNVVACHHERRRQRREGSPVNLAAQGARGRSAFPTHAALACVGVLGVWFGQNQAAQEASMRGVAVYLRGITLFVAGIVVGSILMQPGAAQEKITPLRLNHVGIAVNDYDKALDFYTKVMGFKIAFRFPPSPDGKPTTTYFQISKDTFLEMAPASAQVPAGFTHMGIETSDIKSTISQL